MTRKQVANRGMTIATVLFACVICWLAACVTMEGAAAKKVIDFAVAIPFVLILAGSVGTTSVIMDVRRRTQAMPCKQGLVN